MYNDFDDGEGLFVEDCYGLEYYPEDQLEDFELTEDQRDYALGDGDDYMTLRDLSDIPESNAHTQNEITRLVYKLRKKSGLSAP
jgi:hypothetical protein